MRWTVTCPHPPDNFHCPRAGTIMPKCPLSDGPPGRRQAAPAPGSRSSQNTRNTMESIFHAQWSSKRAAQKMHFNRFTIFFSFLDQIGRGRTSCQSPRIFHYSPVVLLWDFSHCAPIYSFFQPQRVCFDDALT